jgi:hypothetical protein
MWIADPSILGAKITTASSTSSSESDPSTFVYQRQVLALQRQAERERMKYLHAEDEILKVACEIQLCRDRERDGGAVTKFGYAKQSDIMLSIAVKKLLEVTNTFLVSLLDHCFSICVARVQHSCE